MERIKLRSRSAMMGRTAKTKAKILSWRKKRKRREEVAAAQTKTNLWTTNPSQWTTKTTRKEEVVGEEQGEIKRIRS